MIKVIGKIELAKSYYWVGPIEGLVMSNTAKCPLMKPRGRFVYMGWTTDYSWPKTMNTGRVLYKATGKDKSRRRAKGKKLGEKIINERKLQGFRSI